MSHMPKPVLTVDLSTTTGDVMHGANGALYGLSDEGVPSDNILAPLKITTIAQKPSGGAQHPNGDALGIAPCFKRNGGGDIYVYIQDYYAEWPYEELGIEDYLDKIDTVVGEHAASVYGDDIVYVPFNEPDQIWYGLNTSDAGAYVANRDRFFSDWQIAYARIRSIDPDARIAGPNEAEFDLRFLADLLPWAKANHVLPDVMTWHELSPDSLRDYRSRYRVYRKLEADNAIDPLPINIDEYANRRDLSVPGQLIQWASMFEDTKVYADQAYWDIAGNLDGNVVRDNIPNGGWWFFRWYAGLTGQTVAVTPEQPDTIDTMQGLATLDTDRQQAQVILGGGSGDINLHVEGIDLEVFGADVIVTVSETSWSGYDGAHAAPRVLSRTRETVANGAMSLRLNALDRMSAYRVTVTPAGDGTPEAPEVPWSASYEAEAASITGGTIYTRGTVENANGYAASGQQDVGDLDQTDSRVDFTVDVPADGTYTLTIFYGNQTGAPSQQFLRVDGVDPRIVSYPATLNWTYRAIVDVRLGLTAGNHTLSLAKHDPELGTATGQATLDKITLTSNPLPTQYDPAFAEACGSVSYDYDDTSGVGTGSVLLSNGGKATFDVYAPVNGYYTLMVDYSSTGGASTLILDGAPVGWLADSAGSPATVDVRLFLAAGINRISATPTDGGNLTLHALTASSNPDTDGMIRLEAENATLSGNATVVTNADASGGAYVESIGNGIENSVTFENIDVSKPGRHALVVHYANDERAGGHAYNANIISRTADITVNAGATQRVTFRNTYGWTNFWTRTVTIELTAGSNTITVSNPDGLAPNLDLVELAPING